jgi:hypothetical protein
VGNQATVDAVMKYTNAFGAAFLELLTRRTSLLIRKSAINDQATLRSQAQEDLTRFVRMLQQCSLDGVNDVPKIEAIGRQSAMAAERWQKFHAEWIRLSTEQMQEQLQVSNRSMALNSEVVSLLPDAVSAVRQEMELPLDHTWYQTQWQTMLSMQDQAWTRGKERLMLTYPQWFTEEKPADK